MNKKISLGAALALMLIITAVTFSVTMIFSRQMFSTTITNISEKQAMYDKLSEIDSYVRQNYYGSSMKPTSTTTSRQAISPDCPTATPPTIPLPTTPPCSRKTRVSWSASASAPPKTRAALLRSPKFTPTPLHGKRASRPGT